MSDAPVLVLSPHPDDAALGCWSVLDDRQQRAVVVNVFAGVPPAGTSGGWDRECGVPDSVEMMRLRRVEDHQALALAEVSPIQLDFLDSQYVDEARDSKTIAAAVKVAVPHWSAVYAPAATGGYTPLLGTRGMTLAPHPDHEVVREVALLLERWGPAAPTYFYAEVVYALGAVRGSASSKRLEDFTPVLEAATGRSLELTRRALSNPALARRLDALGAYATQLPRLELGVGPFVRDPEVLRHETFWRPRGADIGRGSPRRRRRR